MSLIGPVRLLRWVAGQFVRGGEGRGHDTSRGPSSQLSDICSFPRADPSLARELAEALAPCPDLALDHPGRLAVVGGPALGLPDIGDPFDVEAFQGETIPDDRNAFVLYRQAAALFRRLKPSDTSRGSLWASTRGGPRRPRKSAGGSRRIERPWRFTVAGPTGPTRSTLRRGPSGNSTGSRRSSRSSDWPCSRPHGWRIWATWAGPGAGHRLPADHPPRQFPRSALQANGRTSMAHRASQPAGGMVRRPTDDTRRNSARLSRTCSRARKIVPSESYRSRPGIFRQVCISTRGTYEPARCLPRGS